MSILHVALLVVLALLFGIDAYAAVAGVIPIEAIANRFITMPTVIVYFVVFEGLWGTSLGKLLTRTRVVSVRGGKPRFRQIVIRTLSRLVPFEALSFYWSGQWWHDSWSGIRVVRRTPPKRLGAR